MFSLNSGMFHVRMVAQDGRHFGTPQLFVVTRITLLDPSGLFKTVSYRFGIKCLGAHRLVGFQGVHNRRHEFIVRSGEFGKPSRAGVRH